MKIAKLVLEALTLLPHAISALGAAYFAIKKLIKEHRRGQKNPERPE